MRQSKDHRPVGLLPSRDLRSGESPEEYPFEEAARRPTLPAGKRRWVKYSKRSVYKRRRRAACLVLLAVLAVVVALFWYGAGGMDDESMEPAGAPAGEQALETQDPVGEEEAPIEEAPGEAVPEKEEEAPAVPPDDPTLYLTVPRLGMYDHTVRNDDSEAALDLGAIKLPRTGFPWEAGDTNTYIACHRLGFPNTESFNQCLDLPSMRQGDSIFLKDTDGAAYEYRVTETLVVEPDDTWVTDPVAGKDVISLQTCIEAPGDLYTLGPNWSARFVVRAERIKEGQASGLGKLVGEPAAAYASLLYTPSFSHYQDSLARTASRAGRYTETLFSLTGRLQISARS